MMDTQVQVDPHILKQKELPQVVIVTGYSGAGKNTVLYSLEDIGFFCINNLPGSLLQPFFESVTRQEIAYPRIALGLDVRGDLAMMIHKILRLKTVWPFSLKIVFVASSYEVLLKRFQETRRRHPLSDQKNDTSDAIKLEQQLLQPLCDMADIVLDTNQYTIHQLRRFVIQAFAPEGKHHMMVTVTAFGFKYGVPPESNIVFDARFLPNPYFDPSLKPLNGTDKPVQEYLFSQSVVITFWERMYDFALYTIKECLSEGRFAMNIAIGCTGGRHRSVALAQRLSEQKMLSVSFMLRLRDIERE